ncbi:MAG: type II toxin-antitoxin system VapC family toxin [Coriobacteriia bacterium]|nr:type II toxin-antitoxin system VapC family toxin [Coriobacteriia bacterium]
MYILDTCICVEFLRGRLSTGYQMMRQSPAGLFKIPAISVGELLLGTEKAPEEWQVLERRSVEVFLESFDVAPFDEKCARAYARLRADLEARGCRIGEIDMEIAATALANQAVLVTDNVKEFGRVPGLSFESWHDISDIWQEVASAEDDGLPG